MEIEIRGGIPAEIREDDDGIKVSGHAAVFNQEADIAGLFRERILPGAFAEAITRDDVVFLVNHEGLPLARTRSGTLRLSEDDVGLRMETELDPEDPDVKSIVGKMRRGDLDKMSFGFRVDGKDQDWDDSAEIPLRTIKRASLVDVSIVSHPAYEGTNIGLRSLEMFRRNAMTGRVRKVNGRWVRAKLEEGDGTGPAARRILRELMDQGMTLVDVSEALTAMGEDAARSPGTLSAILNGEIENPPQSLVDQLQRIDPPGDRAEEIWTEVRRLRRDLSMLKADVAKRNNFESARLRKLEEKTSL